MSHKEFTCSSIEDLDGMALQLLDAFGINRVIAFYGEMGAGKTALIKAICKNLGVVDRVTSPTFSIVNEYHTQKDEIIYHFDFYRIKTVEEALDLGYENYFYSGEWCFIEWPEKISNLMLLPHAKVFIKADNEVRSINVVL